MPLITCRKFPSASAQDHRPRRRNSEELSYPRAQPRSEPIPIKYEKHGKQEAYYEQQNMVTSVAKYELATWNMYILISTSRLHARKHNVDVSSRQEIDEDKAQSSRFELNLRGHEDADKSTDSSREDNDDDVDCNITCEQVRVDDSYDGIFDLDL